MVNPVSCAICRDPNEIDLIPVVHKPDPLKRDSLDARVHAFHLECFKGWVAQGKNTCPDCREVVTHFNEEEVPLPPQPPADESNFLTSVREQDAATVPSLLSDRILPEEINQAVLLTAELGSAPVLTILLTKQVPRDTLHVALQIARMQKNQEVVKILQQKLLPPEVVNLLVGNGAQQPVTADNLCLALGEADTADEVRNLLRNKNVLKPNHWKQVIGAALNTRREAVAKLMILESGRKIKNIHLRILSEQAQTQGFHEISQILKRKISLGSRIFRRLGCPIG